jgi:hypothetical protein
VLRRRYEPWPPELSGRLVVDNIGDAAGHLAHQEQMRSSTHRETCIRARWLSDHVPMPPCGLPVRGGNVVAAFRDTIPDGSTISADFHATGSGQGSGESVAQGAVPPPGHGGGGWQAGLAQDG